MQLFEDFEQLLPPLLEDVLQSVTERARVSDSNLDEVTWAFADLELSAKARRLGVVVRNDDQHLGRLITEAIEHVIRADESKTVLLDLVAGANSAYVTEQRGVPHERRHPMIADILTFLGHQSPFLRKLTFVIQKQPDGDVATGLATVMSTTRPTDGYFAVEF